MRRAVTIALCVAVGLLGMVNTAALASEKPGCQKNKTTGLCRVTADFSGTQGAPGTSATDRSGAARDVADAEEPAERPRSTGDGSRCFWDPDIVKVSGPPAEPVPCSSRHGIWVQSLSCYVSAAPIPDQPPEGAAVWDYFNDPDREGAIYRCYRPQLDLEGLVWRADPPTLAAQGPTPGEVAQRAVKMMALRAIDIGAAPRPDGVGLVGMPVWLWVEDPSPATFGPITRTASAGGVTVTATARVDLLTWDLGDGTTIECASAGTPYQESFGFEESPDCGHSYTSESHGRPGGTYTVTATSDWVVEWEGAGQTGTITLDGLVAQVELTVAEAQVLVS